MKTKYVLLPWLALLGVGCQDASVVPVNTETNEELRLDAEIEQAYVTRVNDNGFTDGDRIGVYVVDFDEQGNPGNLQSAGNRADNVRFVYQQDANKWKGDVSIYWKDERTPIDAYGYYPYVSAIDDVSAYPFAVAANQAETGKDGALGAYEASDFLWAKATGVNPGELIRLNYRHLMAGIQITLQPGEGFEGEAWSKLDKSVEVSSTLTQAQIDLRDGKVSPVGTETQTITPVMSGTDFRAVTIPQVVEPDQTLLVITVDGQSYHFVREQGMTYHSGKLHKFTIQVDAPPTGDYRFTLLDEAVTAWENDGISHEAEARSYVCVHVTEPGQLKDCILASGKDYRTIHNLKLTGSITENDFIFIRDEMECLEALNLKEVKIKNVYADLNTSLTDDIIPLDALKNKITLSHIVFPDNLKGIGCNAFYSTQLRGSLEIPEGVTFIGDGAFAQIETLTGTLSLPNSLQRIGGSDYLYDGAFENCAFTSELLLPDALTLIGRRTFAGCSEMRGQLHFPEGIQEIGHNAFQGMKNMQGDIIIPDKILRVEAQTFSNSGFDGGLYLPMTLTFIGSCAFEDVPIGGELVLPDHLVTMEDRAFSGTLFTHVIFPESIKEMGSRCFSDCASLQDTIKIPSSLTRISESVFWDCNKIEAVILPMNLQVIESGAFSRCYSLNYLQCLSENPPTVSDAEFTFGGIAKNNFSVIVPPKAVDAYRNAEGWSEFKRITAYRDFICRPYRACALNAGLEKRELILNADGSWKVTRMPSWCHLSQTTGNNKTALTLTIDRLERGQGNRQDSIVFSLDDGAYTTYCTVEQYDYHYEEDETVTLQTASRGKGIDLFWVGDGFDAQDIAEGTYLKMIEQQVEYFFGIEPYKTYREYFNVHATIALSQESGIGTLNTLRDVKFHSTLADCKTRMVVYPEQVEAYMAQYSGASADVLSRSLVTVCLNTSLYEGVCYMYPGGAATAFCPLSTEAYPYDARGIVQHEAGGHGFGKLGDEYIYHTAFIQTCSCGCCKHVADLQDNLNMGWFRNLSLNGTYSQNEWKHLIFDDRYSDIVDIYEGGYFHSRGVYRSEDNSCMNNNIPYYSTISRQAIVERIMELAGEPFDFEQFVAKDSRQPGSTYIGTTRVDERPSMSYRHRPPVRMKKNPYLN